MLCANPDGWFLHFIVIIKILVFEIGLLCVLRVRVVPKYCLNLKCELSMPGFEDSVPISEDKLTTVFGKLQNANGSDLRAHATLKIIIQTSSSCSKCGVLWLFRARDLYEHSSI